MTLGLALTLGFGAAAGLMSSRQVQKASAGTYVDGTTYYYLTGKFGGVEHWTDYIAAPSNGSDAGVLLNQALTAGDTFKFKAPETWTGALTFGSFNTAAGAYNAFSYNKGDDNTRCAVTGVYNFYIYEDEGMKVSVEFADSNTASYSYVLTSDSELDHTHLYNDTLSLREWASAPSVSGQAYDIKATVSEYDYYGLYRIDDRILSGWDHLIMKNTAGNKQAETIERTVGNKQELYVITDDEVTTFGKTTVQYKAAEFLYELLAHRGAANYDSFDFAFSICAATPAQAYELVGKYEGLTSDVKTFLGNVTVRTYNMEGAHAEDNKAYVTVAQLVNALKPIAAKYGGGSPSKGFFEAITNDNSILIPVVIVAAASFVAIGAFFFIRKRKASK